MPETSRECVVCLLDESSFTVPVNATLLGSELLDMAASHVNIKEKEYFGLYTDGDGFKNWLELDKPVLDPSQDLPKGSSTVKIHFSFKYFVDDLRLLGDYMTVELLYLQSRQAIMRGDISSDDDTIFELAACAMQSQYGEMRSEAEAKQQLNSFPIIPPHVFKRVSVSKCEDQILQYYRMLRNLSRGEAIFKYLEIIQSLPMYSMHYFEVKDKKDVPLWLGVGPDGICQCPHNNRNDPECRFQWLQLQNIYYRDKKFSMEVYQSNKPSKKGVGFGPVVVYAWHGANSKVVMAIWKMARDQHVFYRSKRTNRNPHVGMNQTEITRQLNKLHRTNISPSSSQSSISLESAKSNQTQASAEAVAAAKAAQSEMYSALLARRQNLMAEFEKKAARYKDILVKEMQITGIPPEGLTAEEIEKMRKKFGVSFKFSKFVLDDNLGGGDEVEQLEKQLEIQSSIIEASRTLLDQANNRKLRKDRKKEIKRMEEKQSELKQKLDDLKRCSNSSTRFYMAVDTPGSVPVSRRRSGTPGNASIDDNFLASMIFDTPPKPSSGGGGGGVGLQKSPHHKSTSALSDVQTSHTPPPSLKPQYNKTKSHTLAATDSPSYLSSISTSYADEFDQDLSPSSSIASGNIGFISPSMVNRSTGGPPYTSSSAVGGSGISSRGHGGVGNFEDEVMQLVPQQRVTSPTGSYDSPRVQHNTSTSSSHASSRAHVDIPASSSPITRYKRATSPTINFPTESHRQFVVAQHDRDGRAHHGMAHAPHMSVGGRRSHSPDFPPREGGYSSSYHPPGMMHQAAKIKTLPPSQNYNQYVGGGAPPGHAYPNQQPHTGQGRGSSRKDNYYQEGDPRSPGSASSAQMRYAGGSKTLPASASSQGRPHPPSNHAPATGVTGGNSTTPEQAVPPQYRGPRKASDQEIGLLDMLNVWDKSNKSPFGDGTLV